MQAARRSCAAIAIAITTAALGCRDPHPAGDSDSTGESTTGEPATFGPIGPLVGDDGRGSFRFGAATAATQIEDANVHTAWWLWTAPAPDGLAKGDFVGDASLGYTNAIADIDLLAQAGLGAYRFSIEWARVEPVRDQIDEDALAHYDAMIDALVAAGIRPMITVHHFSDPVWVDDPRDTACASGPSDTNLCGWDHPEGGPAIAEELAEHAALLAARYGDRVDEWGTLNEPINFMLAGYGLGIFPPGKNGILTAFDDVFLAAVRNYVDGHARVYQALKSGDAIDSDDDGVAAAAGLTMGVIEWVAARDNQLSDDPDDVAAKDRVDFLYHRLFVDAALQGAFDADLDGVLEEPHPEWAGTLDWLGVQYYIRAGVTAQPGLLPKIAATPCFGDFDFGSCVPPVDPSYHVPAMRYEHWPPGLYERLASYHAHYPELPLVVTESGIATRSGPRRAEVVVRALEAIERARAEGIDVRGYYHWSLFDNFEWAEGFTPRFGLFSVDREQGFARTPTDAVAVLARIAAEQEIADDLRMAHGGVGPLSPEP